MIVAQPPGVSLPQQAPAQEPQQFASRPATRLQVPRIGSIEFFGLHKTGESTVRRALGVKEGDLLPRSKADAEDHIDHISGVVESHIEGVCCENGNLTLFVGIEEKGATHFELREPPDGDSTLPDDVVKVYHHLIESAKNTARFTTAEDLTQGHALSADRDTREVQEQFLPVVKLYLNEIRHVLHDSADEEQRAIAAYAIGYAPIKADVVDDLQFALKDADAAVRSNATRGLKAIAVYVRLHPGATWRVEATWFVEMLNSLSIGDRTQALDILQILTDKRDPSIMDHLRERSMPALVEMARWKTLSRALPAFILVGRMTDLTDDQIHDAWTKGDRESVITQATAKKKK